MTYSNILELQADLDEAADIRERKYREEHGDEEGGLPLDFKFPVTPASTIDRIDAELAPQIERLRRVDALVKKN